MSLPHGPTPAWWRGAHASDPRHELIRSRELSIKRRLERAVWLEPQRRQRELEKAQEGRN